MTTACVTRLGWLLAGLLLVVSATVAAGGYRQVVDGVAVYFGVVPAELVRGHPREHPESGMHGGPPVGESHLLVALFDDKTGTRIRGAEITATITGAEGKIEKKLEPMVIEDTATYGNYFYLIGPGPYRIDLAIRLPGGTKSPLRARFEWARS
jgi:hypothetical protein